MKKKNKKRPTSYYMGLKMVGILHSRLSMNSSLLNEHTFLQNLVDSPNCIGNELWVHFSVLFSTLWPISRSSGEDIIFIKFTSNNNSLLDQTVLMMTKKPSFLHITEFMLKSKRFINWLAISYILYILFKLKFFTKI